MGASVLSVDMLDDFFSALMGNVEIDIRRFLPFPGEKALEEEPHAKRIYGRDPQTVAHGRIGGRSPSLAENPLRVAKLYNLIHGEEVALVGQFGNEREFSLELRHHGLRSFSPISPTGTIQRQLP